jgi:hypothetical protein
MRFEDDRCDHPGFVTGLGGRNQRYCERTRDSADAD